LITRSESARNQSIGVPESAGMPSSRQNDTSTAPLVAAAASRNN
jgi:hypothetical protein